MALPRPKRFLPFSNHFTTVIVCLASVLIQSCGHGKQVYKSDCNDDKTFTRIDFKQLMDSLDDYDQEYVEVMGKYEEDKGLSALVNDSLFVDHSNKNALWVDFSQDCPLYLSGTHKGFFEYNDGQFTQIKNKTIVIRGMIDLHNKGHLKQYKATIERVSLIKL